MKTRWAQDLVRPLVVGIMVGCVALGLVEAIRLFAPAWRAAFFFGVCVLAAIEAHYSYVQVQTRVRYRGDVWRFRAIELGTLFLVVKAGAYVGDPWADIVADVGMWSRDLSRLFDPRTVTAFILAVLSWSASTVTAHDLDRLKEPSGFHRGERPPLAALTRRFFWGGGVLFVLSGIARVGVAELLNLRRAPISGIVLNVLVYFCLGLFMLGQIRYVELRKVWQEQKVEVPQNLARYWVRYSLLFLALAGLLAFLLPTRYTMGLLDVVMSFTGWALAIISFAYLTLMFLLSWPLWLLAKLFTGPSGTAPPMPRMAPSVFPPSVRAAGPGWLALVQTIAFWALAVGLVGYVLWNYVRDRPELLRALSLSAVVRFLTALWRALRRQSARLLRVVRQRLGQATPTDGSTAATGAARRAWFAVRTARERVLYHYLGVLRRAKRRGFPRRTSETPREYGDALGPRVPDAQVEMELITGSFVEARYSQHPVERSDVAQVREWGQQVKSALRGQRLRRRSGGRRAGRHG